MCGQPRPCEAGRDVGSCWVNLQNSAIRSLRTGTMRYSPEPKTVFLYGVWAGRQNSGFASARVQRCDFAPQQIVTTCSLTVNPHLSY